MFQCEHPEGRHVRIRDNYHYPGPPNQVEELRIVAVTNNIDAPEALQLNWKNWVLWREEMNYP